MRSPGHGFIWPGKICVRVMWLGSTLHRAHTTSLMRERDSQIVPGSDEAVTRATSKSFQISITKIPCAGDMQHIDVVGIIGQRCERFG